MEVQRHGVFPRGNHDDLGNGYHGSDAGNPERIKLGGHGHGGNLPPSEGSNQYGQTLSTHGVGQRHEKCSTQSRKERGPLCHIPSRSTSATKSSTTPAPPGRLGTLPDGKHKQHRGLNTTSKGNETMEEALGTNADQTERLSAPLTRTLTATQPNPKSRPSGTIKQRCTGSCGRRTRQSSRGDEQASERTSQGP